MSTLDHRDVRARLSAYLDDELDPMTSAAIAAHLAECVACTAALEQHAALSRAIRAEAPVHAASDALRARITAALPATQLPRAPGRTRRPAWGFLAAVAAVVVVAALAFGVGRWGGLGDQDRLASEVVASHVRSLLESHLTDVTSTDQHTVKPWFDGRLDFAPPVTDLAAQGFPLLGGRLDYVNGRAVAALVYGRRRHLINLFLWPHAGTRAPRATTLNGYHVLHGDGAGVEYWAVSDVSPADLSAFVGALRLGAAP